MHRAALLALLVLAGALLLGACSEATPAVKIPARLLYQQGEALEDQGLYSEATLKFQQVVDENPGTRLGSYSYLRLATLQEKQEKLKEAETNYRLFLNVNSNSQFAPYAMFQLLQVNEKLTYTGLFFPEKEIDRDMDPSRKIIREFTRFYLLNPGSVYLPEVGPIYQSARSTLARHEVLVGDFYFTRGDYNGAASRYFYVLRNHPEYPDQEGVLRRLITSYRRNQQPQLADEMQRIFQRRFGPDAKRVTEPGESTSVLEPARGPELPPLASQPPSAPPEGPPSS